MKGMLVIAGLAVVGFFLFMYWMLRSCVAALGDDIHDVVDWHYSDYQHDPDANDRFTIIDGMDGHTPDMLRGNQEEGWHSGTEAE